MPITDLLDRVPFSPRAPRAEADAPVAAADDDEAPRPFAIELPPVERIDGAIPLPDRPLGAIAPDSDDAADADAEADASEPPLPPRRPARAPLPPLPSWGIALVGALSLVCLALTAALAIAVTDRPRVEAAPAPADTEDAPAPDAAEPASATPAAPAPSVSPADFSADPAPIPVDLLTRLEQASDEPLDVELSRLLDAIQHGFGSRSAQLEPTLRSYVYRMASRFEWNPDTFRVAVTAPDPDLAAARAALLERLFEDAVAAGRLDVGTGVGPHALTLVSE